MEEAPPAVRVAEEVVEVENVAEQISQVEAEEGASLKDGRVGLGDGRGERSERGESEKAGESEHDDV